MEALRKSSTIKALLGAAEMLYAYIHTHAWLDRINVIDLNKEVLYNIWVVFRRYCLKLNYDLFVLIFSNLGRSPSFSVSIQKKNIQIV